jgi:hypothetical protein
MLWMYSQYDDKSTAIYLEEYHLSNRIPQCSTISMVILCLLQAPLIYNTSAKHHLQVRLFLVYFDCDFVNSK